MKRGKWKSISAIILAALLLTGCGSSDAMTMDYATTESYEPTANGYMTDDIYSGSTAAVTQEIAEEEVMVEDAGGIDEVQPQQTQRKLIKNVNMEVETETFDELLETIKTKTDSMGGYIENSYTYNGSSFYGNTRRDASLTIRIPAENLDQFLASVSEVSNVISRNDSVTDITLQYVDLESHKEALQTEQDRLLELLEQAESIDDIIALESRLSEVRYQIESMESQLRTYDNQVSYSTVYLNINEVTKLTPVKEQSIGEKISTGFMESLYGVGSGLLNFAIGLIIRLPYLVVWAVIIVVIVFIIRAIIKAKKKKKLKKAQMAQAAAIQENAAVQPSSQMETEQKNNT